MGAFRVRPAADDEMTIVAALFREYGGKLGIDLSYQGFEAEVASLPGDYAPPSGALLLAADEDGVPFGCVGVRHALACSGLRAEALICARGAARPRCRACACGGCGRSGEAGRVSADLSRHAGDHDGSAGALSKPRLCGHRCLLRDAAREHGLYAAGFVAASVDQDQRTARLRTSISSATFRRCSAASPLSIACSTQWAM